MTEEELKALEEKLLADKEALDAEKLAYEKEKEEHNTKIEALTTREQELLKQLEEKEGAINTSNLTIEELKTLVASNDETSKKLKEQEALASKLKTESTIKTLEEKALAFENQLKESSSTIAKITQEKVDLETTLQFKTHKEEFLEKYADNTILCKSIKNSANMVEIEKAIKDFDNAETRELSAIEKARGTNVFNGFGDPPPPKNAFKDMISKASNAFYNVNK